MLASNASAALPMSTTFRAAVTTPIRRAGASRVGGAAGRTRCSSAGRRVLFAAAACSRCCWRSSSRWAYAALPALQKFGLGVLRHQRLESGHERIRRAGADLRHAGHVGHRAADRRAGELRHRAVPDRDVPGRRSSGRSARRSSCWRRFPSIIYGMWGLFVFAPFSPITCSRCCTATLGDVLADRPAVPGRAERHRRADGGRHPRRHGDPVHRVGDARRVRDRPAGAEGIGVRPRLHDVGSRAQRRAAVHAGSASSAASCSASAARSARRWP